MGNENGTPEKKFLVAKAISKGLEGALIAGLSGVGGMTSVEQIQNIDMSQKEEALVTVALMVMGFVFRYLRNWAKQKRKKK